jgi:cell shape-determining protein MreC
MKKKSNKVYAYILDKNVVSLLKNAFKRLSALEETTSSMNNEVGGLTVALKKMCDIMAKGFKLYDEVYDKKEEQKKKLLD